MGNRDQVDLDKIEIRVREKLLLVAEKFADMALERRCPQLADAAVRAFDRAVR